MKPSLKSPPSSRLLKKKLNTKEVREKIAKIEVSTTKRVAKTEAKAEVTAGTVVALLLEIAEADVAVTEADAAVTEVAEVATEADVEAAAVEATLEAPLQMRMASSQKQDSAIKAEATTVAVGEEKDAEAAVVTVAKTRKVAEVTSKSIEVNDAEDVAANKRKIVPRQRL